jgi:hypothetical protein
LQLVLGIDRYRAVREKHEAPLVGLMNVNRELERTPTERPSDPGA